MKRETQLTVLLALCTAAILIIYNTFLGEAFYPDLSDVLTVALGIFSSAAAFHAYASLKNEGDSSAPRFWWMAMGLLLWVAADFMVIFYTFALGAEIPAVSEADIFWMLGYLPLAYSLFLAFSSVKFQGKAMLVALCTYIVLMGLLYMSLSGSLVDFEASPLENLVNLAYPLEDILLLSFAVPLVGAYFSPNAGKSWLMLAFGLFLTGLGDLMFLQINAIDVPDPTAITSMFFMLDYLWIGFSALVYVEEARALRKRTAKK